MMGAPPCLIATIAAGEHSIRAMIGAWKTKACGAGSGFMIRGGENQANIAYFSDFSCPTINPWMADCILYSVFCIEYEVN